MRKLLFCLILITPVIASGQRTKLPGPDVPVIEVDHKITDKRDQCFHSSRYNALQRRTFYPFSTAATVKLVSFNDSTRVYTPIAPNNFTVDYSKAIETKTLSDAGIDSLTDILYNVGFTPVKMPTFKNQKGHIIEIAGPPQGAECYNPRNAILFLDSTGRVTQYMEICFECQHYYLSSRKIRFTVRCVQKYDMLKNYFLAQGIKYGAVTR